MIRVGKESRLGSSEVIERAVAYFGPAGLGMKIVHQDPCCARFEGTGGYVFVQVAEFDGQDGSDVAIEGREWEYSIRDFLGNV